MVWDCNLEGEKWTSLVKRESNDDRGVAKTEVNWKKEVFELND